jgi:hypothetical protein
MCDILSNPQSVSAMADHTSERIHRVRRTDFLYSFVAGQTTLYFSGYRRSHFLYLKRHLSSGFHPVSQLRFGKSAL